MLDLDDWLVYILLICVKVIRQLKVNLDELASSKTYDDTIWAISSLD